MSNTQELVQQFLNGGGQIKRLNTMSPSTGQIRFFMSSKRKELEDEGVPVDEMPHWCMTYQEKKERGLLPHQIASRQKAAERERLAKLAAKKGKK